MHFNRIQSADLKYNKEMAGVFSITMCTVAILPSFYTCCTPLVTGHSQSIFMGVEQFSIIHSRCNITRSSSDEN